MTPAGEPADAATALDDNNVFRTLFAAYPDALIVADAAGAIVLANPAAAALLGYTVQELVGLAVDRLVPDATRPRHAAYRAGYAHQPRARPMGTQMELVAKRRDGSEVMVEIALSPLQNLGLPYVVAAIRGIGAYPRVRQALQSARYGEHLAQLGRVAVDARDPQVVVQQVAVLAAQALQVDVARVFLLEPDRQTLRVAAAAGATLVEAVGDRLLLLSDTWLGWVLDRGQAVVVPHCLHETRFSVPGAYLAAGLSSGLAVPLSDRGRVIGALLVAARAPQRFGDDELRFLDSMSNLLATSLQRAQSEEALNHAQRLESVGQLTGGIAHDFNNLLTVIQGNLQVLEDLPALAEDAHGQQLLAAATRATRRGAELTRKLLAFSSRQVLQPSAVDVPALLGSLANMLRRTLDQRIRIAVDVAPGCPPITADPGQLESALLNVAINARDAMPDGGLLQFHAEPCRVLSAALRDEIDNADACAEDFVAIAVSDTGAGMPDEVKERAFEPFFTTKEAGRGTGLGLSTVYGFVKQSQGAVVIRSAPGQGSTLTLYIPRSRQAAAPAARSGGAGDASHVGDASDASDVSPAARTLPRGLRVLLVEDDPDVRAVLCQFLQSMHCRVTEAAAAEPALDLLGPAAAFDVLLSDIALGPGLRGTELAALAEQRHPAIAVLLMSGYPAELIDADRDSPARWELLPKPCTRAELASALARLVGLPAAPAAPA